MRKLIGLMVLASCLLSVSVLFAEPVKLVYWHYFTDRDAVLKKIAADFEKQTGIQVDVQNYGPPEAYDRRLSAAARGKALPDLITITLNITNYAAYVRGGHFLDLTPYMDQEWKSSIPANYLRGFTFTAEDMSVYGVKKAGLYGLPVDANCMAIFYNTKLWAKAGITNVPKTWDEFIAAGKKLRAAGIDPFVANFYGQQWENHTFWMNYAFAYLGTKGFTDLTFGRVKFSDPRVVKSFKIFADMREAKMYMNGITGGINGEDIFPQNKVGIFWFRSWEIGVWKQTAPNFQDFDVFYPPKPADAANQCLLPGGPGAAIAINAKGKNAEAAVKFVKYLTSKVPQMMYAESSQNLPVNLIARKEMKTGSKLAKFVPWMGSLYYGQFQNPPMWGEILSKVNVEIQSIILGEKTPEQVCKFLDEEYERVKKRYEE
ncbi:MAG: extracellular solute-binding protein [bacterium]|nr:extracellular solute-binding protein [bacterium]